mmetsp:Transcript_7452/g.12983  ORF Transcript_7452/g.12983 Transcript_7452/m.12983 type:complete len:240 (+) Transcript_7452:1-720(+)
MAAYKSKKKEAKKSKKKKKSSKSKSSKNNKPKLVHRALSKGTLDLDAVMKKTASSQRERTNSNSSFKSNSSTESSHNGIKPSYSFAEDSEKSRPMKKRRISGKTEDDVANDSIYPISNIIQKNGQVKNTSNPGPHGDLLDQLFGDSTKSTTGADVDATKVEGKSHVDNANKQSAKSNNVVSGAPTSSRADAENAVITDESEHYTEKSNRRDSEDDSVPNEKGEDGHYGAASVLLGLMGN